MSTEKGRRGWRGSPATGDHGGGPLGGRPGAGLVLTSWPRELPAGSGPPRLQQAGRGWLCQGAPQRLGCPDTNAPSLGRSAHFQSQKEASGTPRFLRGQPSISAS